MDTAPRSRTRDPRRRSLLRAAVWSVPAIAAAAAAPAQAASLDRTLRIVGDWTITPWPGVVGDRAQFSLGFANASTVFSAHGLFGSDDPADVWDPTGTGTTGFVLHWAAASSAFVAVFTDPALTANTNAEFVTVDNTEWGYGSSCSLVVTAIPHDGRPSVSSRVDFLVGDV